MLKRWLIYLTALVSATVFFLSYREWFSWLALVGLLCLPAVVLLASLPAMLQLKMTLSLPPQLTLGSRETLTVKLHCPLPVPPVRGKIRVRRSITGESWMLTHGSPLPTAHCGRLQCLPEKVRVYDYLGLFSLRLRQTEGASVSVYPDPIPVNCLPQLERYLSSAWRPKPGGGYAENHELRLYRPGDSLNQIHWKLSAKTGKFVIREAMIPQNSRLLLTLILQGTPEALDRKLGELLWLSRTLLARQLPHEICAQTGDGLLTFPVTRESELLTALDTVLAQAPAAADTTLPELTAAWQHRIGGAADEA